MAASYRPEISDLVERIGLGCSQFRSTIAGGGVWLADGIELSLISAITVAVAHTFDLAPAERGLLVTIVYLGVFFGNLASGPFGDKFGRRKCLLLSYLCIFIFSMASSFSPSYAILALIRFFVGVSFGFGQPAWNALTGEISPKYWRVLVNGGSQSLFSLGEVYCFFLVYLDNPSMKHLNWRLLLREGAIPSIVFCLICFFFLNESPYYLSNQGRKKEAQDILVKMQQENGAPELDDLLDFQDPEPRDDTEAGSCDEFNEVVCGDISTTTWIATYSCFVLNFCFYGSLYAFPIVLPDLSTHNNTLSPAVNLIIGACWEFPGYALAIALAMCWNRKSSIQIYALLCGLGNLMFVVGVATDSTILWRLGFYGIKAFSIVGYVLVYVLISEVFPKNISVTGNSVAIGGGRIGAMIAPLAYELLTSWAHSFYPFFYVIAFMCLSNIPIISLLPSETSESLAASLKEHQSYGATKDTA